MEFVGVYGGLLCAIFGWFFGRQQAKKKNGLDEMYHFIMGKAKSISWFFSLAALYIFMSLTLFEVKIGMMPTLAILLFVQLGSWALSAFVLSIRLTEPKLSNRNKKIITTVVCVLILVFFTILALVTSKWDLILAGIPPIVVNSLIIIFSKVKR